MESDFEDDFEHDEDGGDDQFGKFQDFDKFFYFSDDGSSVGSDFSGWSDDFEICWNNILWM